MIAAIFLEFRGGFVGFFLIFFTCLFSKRRTNCLEIPRQGRITAETIVSITGSAFGEYCNQHLKIGWLMILDATDRQAAIRSQKSYVP
jgi:hypothetical protein